MLYGGIKIEETQSIIVILGEDNKLFIPHDIIVANNTTDIQNFVNSMQRGGITPEKICFAINPVHVDSIETFNSFRQIFMQAAYDLRIINTAAQGDSFKAVTLMKKQQPMHLSLSIIIMTVNIFYRAIFVKVISTIVI